MRRVWTMPLVGVVLAALIGGCGSGNGGVASLPPGQAEGGAGSTAAASSGKLVSGETGFGVSRSDASMGLPDYVWAATMVTNGTPMVTPLTASFAVYDPAGSVIGQSSTSAPIMRTGTRMVVGTQVEVPAGAQIGRVVATVSPLENLAEKDTHPNSTFAAVGVHLQGSVAGGSAKVLGEVVSHYQQPVHQVYVSIACFNAAGAIIGGGEHYVDAIGPGQTVGFASDGLIVSGEPARCEAFPTLSGAFG